MQIFVETKLKKEESNCISSMSNFAFLEKVDFGSLQTLIVREIFFNNHSETIIVERTCYDKKNGEIVRQRFRLDPQ